MQLKYRHLPIVIISLTLIFGAMTPTAAEPQAPSTTGGKQNPLDIIFVLDNSGSMVKNDPDFIVREVVTNFMQNMTAQMRLGMVIFDQDARLVEPLTEIQNAETVAHYLKSLEQINYKGQYTNTPAAVERAIYELKTNGRPEAQKVIILLTDGIVDTGDPAQDLERSKWLTDELTQESEKLGIRIFGIALADQADFRLIQTLAVKTEGEYFRAITIDDIHGILKKIDTIVNTPPPTPKPEVVAIPPKPKLVKPTPPPASPPAKRFGPLAVFLYGSILLLGLLLVIVLIITRKTKGRLEDGLRTPPREPAAMDKNVEAQLIDVENVITTDSKALTINKPYVTIGRDMTNDIVIPQQAISNLHATIEYRNGNFYLEDNRSTNGTSINGRKIDENKPVRLKSGDKIAFAIFEFRFLLPDHAPVGETMMLKKEDIEKLKETTKPPEEG